MKQPILNHSGEQKVGCERLPPFALFSYTSLLPFLGSHLVMASKGSTPVLPSDGEDTPLLYHARTSPAAYQGLSNSQQFSSDVSDSEDFHLEDSRRPSFLGFDLTGSHIKQSKETDRLIMYYQKKSRANIVRELRPQKLIGRIGPLYDWQCCYKEESELEKLPKRVRSFYEDQNSLIEKYQEVDKLLDSGIHHTMIQNYSERNDGENNGRNGSQQSQDNNYPDLDANSHYTSEQALKPPRPQLHRRASAVPGDVDLETGNVLGYNKADEIAMVNFAILVNFFANIVLLIGKMVVAMLTSSISIFASLLDSALDFLSTLIIYASNTLSQSKHSKDYPVGKNRLEPIGVLVFSIIIIICFAQVGLEATERLLNHQEGDPIVEIGTTSTLIMLATIVCKLGCYIWCKSIKSSSVEALTQDALVDVVFNFFSLIMPLLGHHFQIFWFDPISALLLSIYIIVQWTVTSIEHISNLTGRNADPEDFKVILYLCMRFAEKIQMIKDISCYHVGDSINVEVDLILDGRLTLRDSHDIAEALQYTIEALPIINVERAFVHIDYTVGNFRGHLTS